MKPFLYELAETLYKNYRPLDTLTVVFPNRRAVLYFRKHLSVFLERPTFAPRLITIEDFIADLTELKVPDKLEPIHRLFKTYYAKLGAPRYYLSVFLFLAMMSLPLKMLARWLFNLKYIVHIQEIFFNI